MKVVTLRASIVLRALMLGSVVLLVLCVSVFLYVRMQKAIAERFDRQLVACGSTLAAVLAREPVLDNLDYEGKGDSVLHGLPLWRLLRDVQERNHLTYVYTFLPRGGREITYVVDGSPDGEACSIGSQEELPEENVEGIQAAWESGKPFVSGILKYEQWGLLKVSATPIRDSLGRPVAFVGVDLNITTIRRQVRKGVLVVVALSVLAIFAGGWFAFRTEQRLVRALVLTRKAMASVVAGSPEAVLPTAGVPSELRRVNLQWNQWLVLARASDRHCRCDLQSVQLEIDVLDSRRAGVFRDGEDIHLWWAKPFPMVLGQIPHPSAWLKQVHDQESLSFLLEGAWVLDRQSRQWISRFPGKSLADGPFRIRTVSKGGLGAG